MANEKPGGHGERSVAVGVLDMAVWDVRGKGDVRNTACMADCPVKGEVTSSLPEHARGAHGNLAAQNNAQQDANPREAALQGLAKMRALAQRGFAQAVLPPHERPFVPALRALGLLLQGIQLGLVEAKILLGQHHSSGGLEQTHSQIVLLQHQIGLGKFRPG